MKSGNVIDPKVWSKPDKFQTGACVQNYFKKLGYASMLRQEEKGTTEDKMDGRCHRSDQHEFDQILGGSGRKEGLACSGPWGHEESDTT